MKWARNDCTKDIFKTLKIIIMIASIIVLIIVVFINFKYVSRVPLTNKAFSLYSNTKLLVCTLSERRLELNEDIEADFTITTKNSNISSRSSTITSLNNVKVPQSTVVEDKNITSAWFLEIPKIGLSASIVDGTSQAILNQYIGHFSETVNENGNIGLAAHNGGFRVNYFANIKNLVNGDIIYYTYNGVTNSYSVVSKEIIDDMDWSRLRQYGDDRITLITCVTGRPTYRLCVQALKLD